jgi:hypothetical protein
VPPIVGVVTFGCPLLAQSGHLFLHRECLLSGGKAHMTFCGPTSASGP